ncbi:MAG: PrsW family glutamic-type intramembrane protease [bacterium]|nr:PrsW family glutamic-type intramembrane protease [bacterium]
MLPDLYTLLLAVLGGIVPSLIWLWFWLTEDSVHPEPRRMIMFAFIAGMVAVPLAFFAEKISFSYIGSGFFVIFVWAAIEEILKYGSAYVVAFRGICLDKSRCVDEPIDPLIYMITVALGFSALENTLFLINPFLGGDTISGLLTGNLRFIGATLLHVVASGIIGFSKGLSFYKSDAAKRIYFVVGITFAIALHAFFNLSIIISKGENIFLIFGILWLFASMLLLAFERIKRVK